MKKRLFLTLLGGVILSSLESWAAPTSWNNPYLPSARSGQQYAIRYTTETMSTDANSDWMLADFNDSGWTLGAGPIGSNGYGVPAGTAALGTSINNPSGDRFIRRKFTLDRDLSGTGKTVYMACGHDDEGAIWIDGTLIISWENVWADTYVHTMTAEQTALLTKGTHVIAIRAKNNSGGYYWDCGLYGEDLSENLDWGKDTPWTARYTSKDTGYTGGDPGQNAEKQAEVDVLTDPDNDVAGYSWTSVNYNDASWSTMGMPCGSSYPNNDIGTKWEGYYNCYWFRRSFYLSSIDNNSKTYTLENVHDDDYEIYINGHLLGQAGGWSDNYGNPVKLSIPTEYLQIGENVIAAEVQQNWGGALFDCKVTVADIVSETVTFTATGQSVGDASKLFDGDATDGSHKWEGIATDENNYFKTQYALFSASTGIYVNGVTIYTANDDDQYTSRWPRKWKLYGSNTASASTDANDSSWKIIQEVYANLPNTNATPTKFVFNPSQTPYQYFKFEVEYTGGNAYMQVGELKLDYTLTAKSPITMDGAGGNYPDEGSENLFDGPGSTKWCKANDASNWVVFKTAKPIYASNYIIQTANDNNVRDPKTFKLYGALDAAPTTDGSTEGWTEIDSETDASATIPTDRFAFAKFTIDKPGIYQYFMLKVDDIRDNSTYAMQLSEFIFDSPIEVNTYTISNATELAEYARRVNAGEDRTVAKVTNDIVADGNFAPIGTTSSKFRGVFDGQGHSITLNVGSGSEYQGLIGCATGGAVIRNVIARGSVSGSARCAGILGGSQGSGAILIENCGNEADVTTTGANAGGVHGCNNGSAATYTIINSFNTGTIKGGSESAGLSGWLGNGATVTNCYNTGEVTGIDQSDGSYKSFARWNNGTYTNCYNSLDAGAVGGRTDNYPMNKVTSGELCFRLNGDTNDGTPWTQTIGTDGHPIPFSTQQTVHQANTDCFTNLPVSADNVVQISNADELVKFSAEVNNGNMSMNAEVVADIDMTGKGGLWWPIGQTDASDNENNGDKAYTGTFDGKCHTIDNLVQADNTNNNQGLFGVVNGGCVIRNLILGSGCHFKGGKYVGAFVGSSRGAGWVTIQNCGNEGTVTASGKNAAAFIGCVVQGGPATRITDCYNRGNVSGNEESAILTGWFGGHGSVEINNFYNTGTITGHDGGHLYRNNTGITFNNVYHTSANQSATAIGDGWEASGELCYKLGASFKQDLSQEGSYPIPFGTMTVNAGKWFNDTNNDVYYNDVEGNCTVYQLNMDENNPKYAVPANVKAKNVSITRLIPAGQWIGICLPFDYDKPSGWNVRELTGVAVSGENISMKFKTVTSTLEAGKPYLVKPEETVTSIIATNKAIISAASAETTTTIEKGIVSMIGNLAKTPITKGSYYINTESLLRRLTADSANLMGFRVYFTVNDAGNAKLSFDFNDDPTGINAVDNEQGANNDVIYNIAGQKLSKMQKGINIVNGRKIIK